MARKPTQVDVKKEKQTAAKKPEERAVAPREEAGFGPLMGLRDEIDRVFDDFYSRFSMFPFRRRAFEMEPFRRVRDVFGMAAPAIDLADREKEWELTAELPGMEDKDIEVTLSGDVLTISGQKEEEREEKEKAYHMAERRFGSFKRSLNLPEGVDVDKIKAAMDKGVLTVTLPKTAEARKRQRKIEVKAK